ncbi:antitermination protein NusG [Citrobacter freundii]|uniref:antitermination protein NusG n=1 Tax=Citrobacter freundii TaxID=546 RepID=UPI001495ACCB|nr:antitermination protein NusG [Citrobacter freundii]
MALSDRDVSLMKAIAEEFSEVLAEREQKHAAALQQQALRIAKLESEVEGLISLLGEQ